MTHDSFTPRVVLVHITTVPIMLRFLTGQARFFQDHGFVVEAISSPGEHDQLIEFGRREGIRVHAVPMIRSITPLRDLVALVRLWRVLRRIRPTIVHAHSPKGGLLGLTAAWLARVPVRIYHLHGLPLMTARGPRRAVLRWSDKVTGRLANRVLCVSPSIRQVALDERLFGARRARVLAQGTINGLDAEATFNPDLVGTDARARMRRTLGIPEDALVLGFVGRIVRDKGVVELAEAWRTLRATHSDLHLILVGPIEPEDPIPAGIHAELTGDPRVHLVGWVDDTVPYYATMDVFVLPTYREGFPYAPLEAAAMALPVVATAVSGCIDAVAQGVTGTFVPPQDARSLATALMAYLDNPAMRRAHGQAGRERVVTRFGQRAVWDALRAEYHELLAARRLPTPGLAAHPPSSHESKQSRRPHPSVISSTKRGTDVVLALLGLILLAPVFAIVALVIGMTMGRPILFRQVRPGYRAKPFTLLKFRTMRVAHDNEGRLWPDAERITRLGRFLRQTSLDELPQLWNVLRGDLSWVGPRPLLTTYLSLYTPEQARRHEVRPGITGWAQVHGRNAIGWEVKFRYDVWYVDHWSFRVDLQVLAMTVVRVLHRHGISGAGTETMRPFLGSAEDGS